MRRYLRLSLACALLPFASARGQEAVPPPGQAPGQRAPDSVGRARLEGEVRRGFARAVRQRVGLSDEQMTRLRPVAMRYEQQRRQLQMEERGTRLSLRDAMAKEETAGANEIDALLGKMLDIQKRRVQLLESEQRDLAAIMTPVQRAKYMALQEQVRRRMEQMRQRRTP